MGRQKRKGAKLALKGDELSDARFGTGRKGGRGLSGVEGMPGWRSGTDDARDDTGVDFLCSVCGCGVTDDARQCPKCGNRFL
jgi:hypothetical protein